MSRWDVAPYSIDAFCELVAGVGSANRVRGWVHVTYFEEYLAAMDVRAVIVEDEYIDHDFLDDYAAYYVRCFEDYPRRCRRLHFFRCPVERSQVERLLTEGDLETRRLLTESYVGFVVVRPIPQRPIGRTCLAAYPERDGRRFPNLRDYPVNLFGIPLQVRSLAFQQQDRTVAACATSALWSAFQGTGMLFQHRIPSPAEITIAATARTPLDTRSFPATSGLSTSKWPTPFVRVASSRCSSRFTIRTCSARPCTRT